MIRSTSRPGMDKIINSQALNHLSPASYGGQVQLGNPFIKGYSFILFTYIPTQIARLTNEAVIVDVNSNITEELISRDIFPTEGDSAGFFTMMERTFKEINGFNDIDLQTTDMQLGFADNQYSIPTGSGKNMNRLTMVFYELSNNIFKRPIMQWQTSIRSPETGYCTLDNYGSMRDWTVEAIYMNCSPAVGSQKAETRANSLEMAAKLLNIFPIKTPMDHHNYSSGSHDTVELSLEFSTQVRYGTEIEKVARRILASEKFFTDFIQAPMKYENESFVSKDTNEANRLSKYLGVDNDPTTYNTGDRGIKGIPIAEDQYNNIPVGGVTSSGAGLL